MKIILYCVDCHVELGVKTNHTRGRKKLRCAACHRKHRLIHYAHQYLKRRPFNCKYHGKYQPIVLESFLTICTINI